MFDRKDTVGPAMKPRLLTSMGKTLKDRPQLRGGNRSIRGGSNGNGSMSATLGQLGFLSSASFQLRPSTLFSKASSYS